MRVPIPAELETETHLEPLIGRDELRGWPLATLKDLMQENVPVSHLILDFFFYTPTALPSSVDRF